MNQRLTDKARQALEFANQAAKELGHEYIGTEHILLGLLNQGSTDALGVLRRCDIPLVAIYVEVQKLLQPGPDMTEMANPPQTPRTKRVVEFAINEALRLQHDYVGTSHLLVGLRMEIDGVASQVLAALGISVELIRLAAWPVESREIESRSIQGLRCPVCNSDLTVTETKRPA